MTKNMITERRFGPFFWTQFLGAFNDNLLKFAVTLAVTYNETLRGDFSAGLLINLIAALFILPFFLFSATSGQLADKHDKARVMQLAKWLEPPIVILTAIGFAMQSAEILMGAVFLLGSQSSFFGPAKYAYLPAQMNASELVKANALVETATFVAILLGTIAAGTLMSQETGGTVVYMVCVLGLVVAGLGLWQSLRIPATPSNEPDLKINWNLLTATGQNVGVVRKLGLVWPSLLGISWLWFVGATYLTQFPLLTKSVLNSSAGVATFLLFLFTVGLGMGAYVCERWSHKRIEMGLVPLGLLVMITAGVALQLVLQGWERPGYPLELLEFVGSPHSWLLIGVFLLLSAGVGLYSVPLYASIQAFSPVQLRSRVIAANNIINSFFMVASAGVAIAILTLTSSVLLVFLAITVINVLVFIIWVWKQPYSLLRLVGMYKLNSRQRGRVENPDLLIGQGGALVVFPTLLHEESMQRLMCLPVPFGLVLAGRMPDGFWARWLRRHGFIFEFKKLKELEGQKALLTHIGRQMAAGKILAIDKAMYDLMAKEFRLLDLPAALHKKNVKMQILKIEKINENERESSSSVWRLTHES